MSLNSRLFAVTKLIRCKTGFKLASFALALLMALTLGVNAAVVKSKGVPRIVDGPHGEEIRTSVLDTSGTKTETTSHRDTHRQAKQEPDVATPTEVDVNTIEYHDEPILPEQTAPKNEDNGLFKLIAVAVTVLLVGIGVIMMLKKRNEQ